MGDARPSPSAGYRLRDVDALRGFALLGILMVNACVFASTYYATGVTDPAFDSALDQAVRFVVALLFETKFYLLFSFLFGYSFTLQIAAAERAGVSFRPRLVRRQLGLLCIGLVHGLVFFHGDILVLYALLGLALLALRGLRPRTAVRLAFALVVLPGLLWLLLGLAATMEAGVDPGGVHAGAAESTAALRGSIASVVGEHASQFPATFAFVLLVQGPSSLAMFLVGLAAGKRRLLAEPEQLRPFLRRVVAVALPLGLAGSAVYAAATVLAPGSGTEVLGFAVDLLTAPLLTASYVALALLAFRTPRGSWVADRLAPPGRTALTNYLLQSLALGVVFTAYGLGLTGRVGPLPVIGIVLGIFATQLWLSAWWLRTHEYGPVEWLLRALTTLSWPRWRSQRPAAASLATGR